jgi:hypothetical protein
MTVKSITICNEGGFYYEVGFQDVTEIREAFKNGEMALKKYYEVYKGDWLFCEVHNFDKVEYFIEEKSQ